MSTMKGSKWEILLTLLTAVVLLLVSETLARASLSGAFQWIVNEHPLSAALNVLVVCMLLAGSVGVMGKVVPGLLPISSILVVMSLITFVKQRYLLAPFYAWDLSDIKEVFAVLPEQPLKAAVAGTMCLLIATCVVTVVLYFRIERRVTVFFRSVLIGGALFFFWAFYQESGLFDIRSVFRVHNITWDQTLNYQANGFMVSFMMNVSPLLISQPEYYDEEVVKRLLEDNEALSRRRARGQAGPPISLVVFVSESFFDLEDIPYVASDYPLKTFEQLKATCPTFRMISPSFGGNTSNVEFELLTGLSNAFLPAGAIPFDHYLKKPVPSIAHVLRNHGYRTTAIHPFYDWFWNRRNVYPLLGFEEFISLSSFELALRRGYFVSDEALVDKIIEWISDTDRPFFLYAVSIQNHGSYWPHRYAPDEEVEVIGEYPDELRLRLQTYITGLRDADRQLDRLLTYLGTRKDPIVCLFTGDHLPNFGPDMALYREAGIVSSPRGQYSLQEKMKTSSVPCLLWANKKGLIDVGEIPKEISPAYCPAILLHQLGIPLPNYMFFFLEAMKEYPVIHPSFVLKPGGELVELKKEEDNPLLRAMKVLQYDILFGSQYCLN